MKKRHYRRRRRRNQFQDVLESIFSIVHLILFFIVRGLRIGVVLFAIVLLYVVIEEEMGLYSFIAVVAAAVLVEDILFDIEFRL